MNESNDVTSKQDKEAFEKWFKEKRDELERNECATYVDSDEWCMSYGWQAACEYKDAQYRPRYEESEDAIYINGKKFYSEKSWRALEDEQVMHIDFLKETFKEKLEKERAKSKKLVEALNLIIEENDDDNSIFNSSIEKTAYEALAEYKKEGGE